MSSRSTKPGSRSCPECPTGQLERVLSTRSYKVDGEAVIVEGLLPFECSTCHAVVWPEAELVRGKEILTIKTRKAAA